MTSRRRSPCELYRVYDEDEFFACGPEEASSGTAREPDVPLRVDRMRSRPRRAMASGALLVGLGALAAAIVAGGAPSAPFGHRSHPGSSRTGDGARVLLAQAATRLPRPSRRGRAHPRPARRPAMRRAGTSAAPAPTARAENVGDRESATAPPAPRPVPVAFVARAGGGTETAEFGFERGSGER
jgi:hypothetical protein